MDDDGFDLWWWMSNGEQLRIARTCNNTDKQTTKPCKTRYKFTTMQNTKTRTSKIVWTQTISPCRTSMLVIRFSIVKYSQQAHLPHWRFWQICLSNADIYDIPYGPEARSCLLDLRPTVQITTVDAPILPNCLFLSQRCTLALSVILQAQVLSSSFTAPGSVCNNWHSFVHFWTSCYLTDALTHHQVHD